MKKFSYLFLFPSLIIITFTAVVLINSFHFPIFKMDVDIFRSPVLKMFNSYSNKSPPFLLSDVLSSSMGNLQKSVQVTIIPYNIPAWLHKGYYVSDAVCTSNLKCFILDVAEMRDYTDVHTGYDDVCIMWNPYITYHLILRFDSFSIYILYSSVKWNLSK